MTSSQPVTTPNALNFTPDNKRCYAYSGAVTVTNVVNTLLEFSTNSEYLKVKVGFYSNGISNDDYNQIIYFNDVAVISQTVPQTYQSTATGYQPIELIIPPFTDVKITFANVTDTSSNVWTLALSGEAYGMSEVGYQ
jgi:hypothetical protein